MQKPRLPLFALSIRKLLILLVALNIGALLLLGTVSITSNHAVERSQRDLIAISEVQARRSDILTATQAFIARQAQIVAAASTQALLEVEDPQPLASQGTRSIEHLEATLGAKRMRSDEADAALQMLTDAFDGVLGADAATFETTEEILGLQEALASLATEADTKLIAFQSSVDEVHEEIAFLSSSAQIAMKKLLRTDADTQASPEAVVRYREAGERLISDEIRRATELVAQVRLEGAELASLAGLVAQTQTPATLKTLVEHRMRPLLERMTTTLSQLPDTLSDDGLRTDAESLASELDALRSTLMGTPGSLAAVSASVAAARERRDTAVSSAQTATTRITDSLAAVGRLTDATQSQVAQSTQAALGGARATVLIVSGITVLLAIGIGSSILWTVLRPLQHAVAALEDIGQGEGDLTRRLAPSAVREIDALADAFNRFAEKVASLVGNVAAASQRLLDHTARSAEVSSQISDEIIKQQRETEHLAEALSELSSSISVVAENGERASGASQSAQDRASDGRAIVESSQASIEAVANEIEGAAVSLSTLAKDTRRVDRVLEVINDVAEQTSLLALNAAIEAARAGEQGRGFAVVADEVRALASKTQQSTIEIAEILDRLRRGSSTVSGTIGSSHQKAASAVSLAHSTNQRFDEIVEAITAINQMSSDISSAVIVQSRSTESIDEQVGKLRTVSRSTAQGAEMAARMTGELTELGQALAAMVSQFKLGT